MPARRIATRRMALAYLAAGSITGATAIQRAAGQTVPASAVDLNLVLAVDASGSVNQERFELQRRGYADAFANRQVLTAIRSGPNAAIAAMMFQWTGPRRQAEVVPWSRLSDETSVDAFAAAIAAAPRVLFGGGTSVSGAIDAGMQVLTASPFPGGRRVIDISGDGANNRGRPADPARDEAVAAGININGLPILEVEPDLEDYYRDHVIGGPGAFVVAAATFRDFGTAVLRKLILEIAQLPPAAPVAL